jgi:glycosyltransferase involved in cell wall biosynthesis
MSKGEPEPENVSVVIPVYNNEETIEDSVRSALEQTHEPLEVIVVDDGSTDATTSAVPDDHPKVRLIQHVENRGGSAARNTGIDASNGDYVAFLDADDEWLSPKLEQQLSVLRSKPETFGCCYCAVHTPNNRGMLIELTARLKRYFTAREVDVPKEGGKELIPFILDKSLSVGGASTLLVTKDTVDEIGGWDEDFERHQDFEFLIRLLKVTKLAYVDTPLVKRNFTGHAAADSVARTKKLYFQKFSREIREFETCQNSIYRMHTVEVARYYLREYRWHSAIRVLMRYHARTSDFGGTLQVCRDMSIRGLRDILLDTLRNDQQA